MSFELVVNLFVEKSHSIFRTSQSVSMYALDEPKTKTEKQKARSDSVHIQVYPSPCSLDVPPTAVVGVPISSHLGHPLSPRPGFHTGHFNSTIVELIWALEAYTSDSTWGILARGRALHMGLLSPCDLSGWQVVCVDTLEYTWMHACTSRGHHTLVDDHTLWQRRQ